MCEAVDSVSCGDSTGVNRLTVGSFNVALLHQRHKYNSKFLIPTGQTRDAPQHCEGKKACMCRRREVLEEPEGYADCGGAENAVDQHIETASYWLDARWLYAELFLLWFLCQAPAYAIK